MQNLQLPFFPRSTELQQLNKENDLYKLFMGQDRDFKPYYIAHKKIETLALLDEGKCSICFNWRPHDEANRSESVISANNIITLTNHIPLYIGLAPKATELHMLGMSITGISKALKVSKDTVIHALNHLDRN